LIYVNRHVVIVHCINCCYHLAKNVNNGCYGDYNWISIQIIIIYVYTCILYTAKTGVFNIWYHLAEHVKNCCYEDYVRN
jgi:hypothetical protein